MLGLVKPRTIGLGPSQSTVSRSVCRALLPSSSTLSTPAQLGVICTLTEAAFNLLVQIVGKGTKQSYLLETVSKVLLRSR